MVWGVCRALTPECARDAYQEIWEKVFRGLPRFDPAGRAALSTWIHTVGHNHIIDLHRRTKTRGVSVSLEEVPPVESQLDARLNLSQRAVILEGALLRLPVAQRRAVVLHYLDELSVREVAEQEGVPVGTIKTRLHHGRARLLEILTPGRVRGGR